MSNVQRFEQAVQLIHKTAPDFKKLAEIHGAVHFEREASFAVQALKNNNFLASTSFSNPDSLKTAVLNVAAVGLSLSPVKKQAYLVPRDGKVCLDVSYLGYIQLAVEVGAIKWALAEIVHKNDQFRYSGVGTKPVHEFEPFGDRGEIVGAYCVAKTHDGEFITAVMPVSEIYGIRDRTSAWKAYKDGKARSCPWATDESEMIKKTVIKRAYKLWPKVDTREGRFEKAIDITNQADPIDFDAPVEPAQDQEKVDNEIQDIRDLCFELDREEAALLSHLTRTFNREIEKLEDLTAQERTQTITMLEQFLNTKRAS